MRTATTRVRLKGTDVYVAAPATPMPVSMNAAVPEAAPAAHRGASTGRRLGNWRPTGAGPNAIVAASGPELVRRSRDLSRNNLHGRHALGLYQTHIVGTGIKPVSLCSDPATRDRIHALWDEWVDYADADGNLDFYGLQTQAVGEMVEGGEAFGRIRARRADDGLPVPLQIQIIPTEQVPLHHATSYNGNTVLQGIERDRLGRRVAYWMHRAHPGDLTGPAFDLGQLSRVDAADVFHLRLAPAGQLRGLPWLAVAVATLPQLGDWKDAGLLRKQLIASLVGFVRRAIAQEASMEDLTQMWKDVEKGLYGDTEVTLEPGTMQYLMPGEEVEFTQWQETSGADEVFERSSLRSVAAGLDLIYEELSGDWNGVNDRTYRAAFATFKRRMRQHQHQLVGYQYCRPVWLRWLTAAVASGALPVPAGVSLRDLQKVEWRPERWEYLNPKQDIEADLMEIEGGLASRQAKIADRGDSADTVDEQRAADRDREDRLELPPPARSKTPAPAPQPEADQ